MKTSRAIALLVYLFSFLSSLYLNIAMAEESTTRLVSAFNYTLFLKSCANEDPYHFYEELGENHSARYPVVRLGTPGSYHYELLLEDSDSPILFTSAYDALTYKLWTESALLIGVTQDAFFANADSFLDGSELDRIFHTDHLRRPGREGDVALDSHCDLDNTSARESLGQTPPRSLGPPVVPHQASQPPRHDQYEIYGLGGITRLCNNRVSLSDPLLKSSILTFSINPEASLHEVDDTTAQPVSLETLESASVSFLIGLTLFAGTTYGCYKVGNAWHDYRQKTYCQEFQDLRGGHALTRISADQDREMTQTLFTSFPSSSDQGHQQLEAEGHLPVFDSMYENVLKYIREDISHDFFNETLVKAINAHPDIHSLIKGRAHLLSQKLGEILSTIQQGDFRNKFFTSCQGVFKKIDDAYYGPIQNNALVFYQLEGINNNIPEIKSAISNINSKKKENPTPAISKSSSQEEYIQRTPSKTTSEIPPVSGDSLSLAKKNTSSSKKVKLIATPQEEMLDINQVLTTRVLLNPRAELEKQLLYTAKEFYQCALDSKRAEHTSAHASEVSAYDLRNAYEQVASLMKEGANKAETFDSPSNRVTITSLISDIELLCAQIVKTARTDIKELNPLNKEFKEKMVSLSTIMTLDNKDTGNDHGPAKITESLNTPSPQAHHAELLVNLLIEANSFDDFRKKLTLHTRNSSLSTDTSESPECLEQSKIHLHQAFENLKTDFTQNNILDNTLCLLKAAMYYRKAAYHYENNPNNLEIANLFVETAKEFALLNDNTSMDSQDEEVAFLSENNALRNEFINIMLQQVNQIRLNIPTESSNYQQSQNYLNIASRLYHNIPKEDLLSDSSAWLCAQDSLHSLIDAVSASDNSKDNLANLHVHQAYASWMMFQNQRNPDDLCHHNAWKNMYEDVSNAITELQKPNSNSAILKMHLNTAASKQRKAEGSFIDFIYSRLFSRD